MSQLDIIERDELLYKFRVNSHRVQIELETSSPIGAYAVADGLVDPADQLGQVLNLALHLHDDAEFGEAVRAVVNRVINAEAAVRTELSSPRESDYEAVAEMLRIG